MSFFNRPIKQAAFLLLCTLFSLNGEQLHIGLCIVATGKYITFVKPLLDSAEKYFCPHHRKSYFIFTDSTSEGLSDLLESSYADNIVITYQKRLGWPYDTLMRFSIYNQHKDLFASTDYMFATDADMLFIGTWVQGFILFGVKPADADLWVPALPSLQNKSVAIFCTYAFNPRGSLEKLKYMLEDKGANIISQRAFQRDQFKVNAQSFALQSVEALKELAY